MAAYAALVSLIRIINDITHHHSPPISLDKQQVESIAEIVTFLQEFLQGYNSPVADADEADPLEMRIADAAYAAEDAIESNIVGKIQLSRSKEIKTSRFFTCFRVPKNPENVSSSVDGNHEDEQIKLYQTLQQVIEEMNLIKKVAMETDVEKTAVDNQLPGFVSASGFPSTGQHNGLMVCTDDDVLLGLMEKLADGRLDLQIIPIVGMGGIGKTTLAATVYSKPLIKEHFDICVWATISQQYNTREILCELLSQASSRNKEELSERSEEEVGSVLHKYLSGKRFLIVMDDMWSIEAWDETRHFFPNNRNGSRVLVTTRLSQLSSQLNSNYSLQMEFLDEASSWDLFSKTVFREENCPRELEKVGKKIVHNCRGLPLSIVVIGGILKKLEHTQECWESISKNLTSTVNLDNDKHCLRLLRLSYDHLPVYLKPCFLYMGVFEEDNAIRVSTLVRLWVSEGFLKPIEGVSLETIAQGFFKDLFERNLILPGQYYYLGSTGNIKYCKVHDLLRDFCLKQSRKDGFYHVIGQSSDQHQGISSQRRIVIPRNTSKKKAMDELQSLSQARSVISEYGKVPECNNLGLLRTLHAYKTRYYGDESYVNSLVSQYVNLRHLVVEVRSTSSLFSSISLLWNLHTLIISCARKSTAPAGIWEMPKLRHIEFVGRSLSLPDPPRSDDHDVVIMENLLKLKGVSNLKCGDEVVKRIPNIKKLGIRYHGREGTNHEDHYCFGNIICLESLTLSYDEKSKFRGIPQLAPCLQKLTFPDSLKKLSFDMMDIKFGLEDVLEKIGSLAHLEKLHIWGGSFRGGEWEIVEGQFPSLKYLVLRCDGLKQWTAQESSIFPRLEQLYLQQLQELEEIPREIGNSPTLQYIELIWCSASAVKSAKDVVEEQMEFQGEQLPFRVFVSLLFQNEELQSLAGPNFEVRA